jgi:hypothetical protein
MRSIVLGIASLAALVACRSTPRESVGTTTTTSARVGQELEATEHPAELPPDAATATTAEAPARDAAPSSPYYSIIAAPNLAENLDIGEAGAPVVPTPPATAPPDAGPRPPSAGDAVPWAGGR